MRFVAELNKFVEVDSDGINVLSERDQNWLAMRDAIRDIECDVEFGDRRVPRVYDFAGTAYDMGQFPNDENLVEP